MAHSTNKYKLTYFDIVAGRGEPIRLAFHIAGIPFEDERIKFPDWPARKPTTPFASIPVLTINGTQTLTQSNAILHYVGEISGLYPKDPFHAAKVDELMHVTESYSELIFPTVTEPDVEKKKKMRAELADGKIGDLLKRVEECLSNSGDLKANPFCGGTKMTVGDLKFGHSMHGIASGFIEYFPDKYLERFPSINRLQAAVYDHPKVKEYYMSSSKIASLIWFTTKEGDLDKFTSLYHQHPFRVISSHNDACLYTIGQAGTTTQTTVVMWNNEKDKEVGQAREELKTAIAATKNSGLIEGAPVFRNSEIRVEIKPAGKSVKSNSTALNLIRLKAHPGKLDELAQYYTTNIIPHLRQFPEQVVRYYGGVDKKENEWIGIAYYATKDSPSVVTGTDTWAKLIAGLQPHLAEKPQTTMSVLKHAWES